MTRIVKMLKVLLMTAMICMPALLMAQGEPGFGDDTIDVPFDGGVSLLVAAGIGYGLKKARNNKKSVKIKENHIDC